MKKETKKEEIISDKDEFLTIDEQVQIAQVLGNCMEPRKTRGKRYVY